MRKISVGRFLVLKQVHLVFITLTYIIIYATSLASMEAALSVGRSLSSPLTRTIWHATSKILPTCICSILFETFCKCNEFVLNGI